MVVVAVVVLMLVLLLWLVVVVGGGGGGGRPLSFVCRTVLFDVIVGWWLPKNNKSHGESNPKGST